ncbi:phosphate transport system substrate-binding protein [Cruoricaptor ignavus]|uniref:Phosphate transport system substrate-binding protein n=1 Tax=Cruoricaptor ignavus TaxID=1118202 RepID=A0A1M6A5Q2_9FLAO|nr:substrate-binding domain-containing protein [Cruoricaptor ignavus]SHI31806.1 phosphate transport system substrate-binding protein [Cruoricaptor ignavus]
MNKFRSFFYVIFPLLFLSACKKKKEDAETYYRGNLTVYTDESFVSVVQALADAYAIAYPEAKISVETEKEDLSFLRLLKKEARLIVLSRCLTEKEQEEYKRITGLKFTPAPFAADALVFIVPKNDSRDSVSVSEIEKLLSSDEKPIIFDGANASNLNFIAQRLGKKANSLKYSVLPGNKEILMNISKFPGKIGAVSLNSLSRQYDPKTNELMSGIKILKVYDGKDSYLPDMQSLRSMKYPFTRVVYFLENEGSFLLANGFVRFSCTHVGQKVVQKEGLQPYNLYKREVQMR